MDSIIDLQKKHNMLPSEKSHYENIATFSDKSEVMNNRTVRIY